jgi:hypothetical protein
MRFEDEPRLVATTRGRCECREAQRGGSKNAKGKGDPELAPDVEVRPRSAQRTHDQPDRRASKQDGQGDPFSRINAVLNHS